MIGYKGFNKDFKCRGYQYEVGKTYEHDGDIELCRSGFHFCKTMANVFSYYSANGCRYAEVEATGEIKEGDDKCVTNKIRIIREIPRGEAVAMSNTGNWNTGNCNTGNWNTGNCNTGNWNTGDYNTGNWNTGNWNTGNCNTGNWNTGNWNTGNWNTGDYNTGNRNTGNWNTGDWNTASFSSGCFCTGDQKILMFDKPSEWTLRDWWNSSARRLLNLIPKDVVEWVYTEDMSEEEKERHPEHKTTGGYLKVLDESKCAQIWWNGLKQHDRHIIMDLPNFDAEIFLKCTGIKV